MNRLISAPLVYVNYTHSTGKCQHLIDKIDILLKVRRIGIVILTQYQSAFCVFLRKFYNLRIILTISGYSGHMISAQKYNN